MKNAKIRTQTGLLIAALIFVAIGYAVVVGAQRLIADSEWVAHTNAVIGQLDELEATLRDAESAQRGYLLTGDADYLADYRNVRDRLPSTYEKLRALTADNPQQQARTPASRRSSTTSAETSERPRPAPSRRSIARASSA